MIVIESKQADIKKPTVDQKALKKAQQKKMQAEKKALKKQAEALAKKEAALKQQQAAAALKAMALNSIQSAVQSQQQQAAAAAAQQRLLSLKEQYMALIQQTIRANWINQFNPDQNLTATLHIDLDPQGNVLSVSVEQTSGNPTFDRQAILAVRKSSPLPMPEDPTLLKDFLSITLPFSNQGGT
ncbi:MAG: cell envelope integrity protein TolA [Gammaproteobacteria bacterium]|nr:cell envelope integrity protein TolA [Gammaproteobacteria bacterium]